MGIFSKLFGKSKSESINGVPLVEVTNEECKQLFVLKAFMDSLFAGTHYVARSEYLTELDKFKEIIVYFAVLDKSGMLGSFCAQNGVDELLVKKTMERYQGITALVDAANEEYIQKHLVEDREYLDHILCKVDSQIVDYVKNRLPKYYHMDTSQIQVLTPMQRNVR